MARLRVLDAGCGRRIKYRLSSDAYVVGIDVDGDALALNDEVDERIVGDVQTYPLPKDSFDAVTCFDVLEHLPRPEAALASMARSLKPGGELHLGIPNLRLTEGDRDQADTARLPRVVLPPRGT